MSDASRSMFAREVDFKLEVTINAYAACRALSVRARDINGQFKQHQEGTEVEQPNPTVGALSDCLLYTSPSPRDLSTSRMPSSA